jgi:predicted transcriptional regulator
VHCGEEIPGVAENPLSNSFGCDHKVRRQLQRLPDDSTLEDIQYHLYVLEEIKRGRADITAGRSYTETQARERLSRWFNL